MANYEFNRHKKSDKIKWVIMGVAFVLVFVFLIGLCMQLFAKDDKYKPSEWFKKPDTEQTTPENDNPETAAISYIAPRSLARATALSETVAYSNETYSSLGFSLTDTEFSNLEMLFGRLSVIPSFATSLVVGNSINNQTMTGVLALRGSSGGVYPGNQDIFLLPKENVFGDLSYCAVSSVAVTCTGTYVSPCTVYSQYLPENFYVYICTAYGGSDFTVTYNLFEVRNPVPLPADPVKEGYTFVGWYFDSNFTEQYDGRPIFEDTALYAKFEINRYTVTFNSDGGSSVSAQTLDWNTSATLSMPERDGYTFKGWYLSDGTEYTNQPVTADITLTAHWEINHYTVTFYVDGEVYSTKSVEHGSQLIYIASEQNLVVMSVYSDSPDFAVETLIAKGVTTDLSVTAMEMDGTDKVINTVKNNKWAIIGGVAGGVALIAVIAVLCNSIKCNKR